MFKVTKRDSKTKARTGIIETPHGIIETPAYAIVGTHGQIKYLSNDQLRTTQTGLIMTNTFHLWQNAGGLTGLPAVQNFFGSDTPTMTDSGGFQVFSFGFAREHRVGKIGDFLLADGKLNYQPRPEKNLVRITEDGVWFRLDENDQEEKFLGPELSIKIQEKLGADLIMSFDECTSPRHNHDYTKKSLEQTHRWARICLETKKPNGQLLYGIIQGGEFQDLREESAKFVNSLPFGGIAIGGSLGKSKSGMFDVLRWTIPYLDDRPRHFLGIGQVPDIFESVELGIDTFDCVIPTREARHGGIYTKRGRIDITRPPYQNDYSKLDQDCQCPACQKVTKAELRRQFKTKNPEAGSNATIHNVYFFNQLMMEIREAIKNDQLQELKKEYLGNHL